tara:strand:+ start:545 stop:967 length:423 start_codon:yes stop_codon:yes gene_type:complete
MRMEPLRHVNVMSAKRMAFPALRTTSVDAEDEGLDVYRITYITRYGVCWPPAPTDCIAFHKPGAVKAQKPTTVAWKKTPWYQLYGRSSMEGASDGGGASVCEASLTMSAMVRDEVLSIERRATPKGMVKTYLNTADLLSQ